MAQYTPNTWSPGDTVTKTKLDRLEAGTAAALPVEDAPEIIRDTIGTALVAGPNVTITANDAGDTITVSAATTGSAGIPAAIVNAKGDLLVGTADDTVARLAVGSTGQVLKADSTTSTGLAWGTDVTGGGSGGGLTSWFDVTAYGAVGNGSTDDTAAFQSAINAALARPGSTLYIPAPPSDGSYRITDTLKLYNPASSSTQYHLNVRGELSWHGIMYNGAGNKPVFQSRGLKFATIDGLHVTVGASVQNVVIWDMDVGSFGGVKTTSSGVVKFQNCMFSTNASSATIVGWRMSHSSNSADISAVLWDTCYVQGDMGAAAGSRGTTGWVWEGSNVLNMSWLNCSAAFCGVAVTTIPTSGSTGTGGGDAHFFYGCSFSHNDLDFALKTTGNYLISGGRFEEGRQFLSIPWSGFAGLAVVTIQGVKLETYAPPGGRLIDIGSAVLLTLQGTTLRLLSSAATAGMIYANTASGAYGSILLENCALPGDAPSGGSTTTGPTWVGGVTTGAGTWKVHLRTCVRTDAGNLAISMIDY
jgi:hypothetical protein